MAIGKLYGIDIGGGGGVSAHADLTGLAADDHTQYLLTDGTRTVIGDFTVSGSVNLISSSYKISGDNAISFPVSNTNIAIGHNSGSALTTGASFNTLIGSPAAASLTTGDRNQVIGYSAGYWLTTGSDNILIGNSAGQGSNGHGAYNNVVCIGGSAGSAGIGDKSVCIGYQSGLGAAGKTHTNSVLVGYQSGYSLAEDTGSVPDGNVCVGHMSGYRLEGTGSTTPDYNVLVGEESARNTISGSNNVVIGRQAGYNTLGDSNVFVGYQSGYNETGSDRLYISNSNTTTPLIYGEFDNDLVKINGDLDVTGDVIGLQTSKTITNPTDAGTTGDICWDSSYIYVCISTDTWKRAALSSWGS